MKKAKFIIIAIMLVAIASVGAFLAFGTKEQPLDVQTTIAKTGNVSTVITATGTIEAVKQVEVGTQVSGVVEKIYVDYNSSVKAGQLIAELDKENLQEQLTQAQAAYTVSAGEQRYLQTVYDRQKSLFGSGVISKSDYQEAEYNLNTAKGTARQKLSDLKKAQTNLGYANIYSPINGVVLSRAVDEGQTVAASYSTPTLFTIAQDLKQMQVEADVDEADIGNVKQGQRVEFTVDAFPGQTFSGSVSQVRLNATVTSNVVTYTVIIKADNPDEKLKPGLTATVSIYTMEVKDVLTVEAKALTFTPDEALLKKYNAENAPNALGDATTKPEIPDSDTQKTIWIQDDGGIHPQLVKVGVNDGINYEILDGLKDGVKVVTSMSQASGLSAPIAASSESSSPFMPKPPGKRK
ncbi:MAG: efflux RND transporter periplasmic adaptor subunit [Flavobacterium sp.]|uniref:efflux RND transporter periplasmic adaptor subunit n=1 Tax=Flavobacterium sp. TaxID=239 RepID=UPI00120DC314|nr:efflux RND transporter periplasmic adaptor subunit [Flavobacterium sp.]RZJ67649.1 MAG: efflux RND transporter periplasmic adaptor subunit [Flavobacterium sp.]